jgi:hypothetical protein
MRLWGVVFCDYFSFLVLIALNAASIFVADADDTIR